VLVNSVFDGPPVDRFGFSVPVMNEPSVPSISPLLALERGSEETIKPVRRRFGRCRCSSACNNVSSAEVSIYG